MCKNSQKVTFNGLLPFVMTCCCCYYCVVYMSVLYLGFSHILTLAFISKIKNEYLDKYKCCKYWIEIKWKKKLEGPPPKYR